MINPEIIILQIQHKFFQERYISIAEKEKNEFNSLFEDLTKTEKIFLILFFLEGVANIAELNLSDGLHPNARGMSIVAENVWLYLRNYIKPLTLKLIK